MHAYLDRDMGSARRTGKLVTHTHTDAHTGAHTHTHIHSDTYNPPTYSLLQTQHIPLRGHRAEATDIILIAHSGPVVCPHSQPLFTLHCSCIP